MLGHACGGEARQFDQLARRPLVLPSGADERSPHGMSQGAQNLVEVLLGGQISSG